MNRQIKELETKLSKMEAAFRKVKPGPNLAEEYRMMKRQIVGSDSQKIGYKSNIIELDVT